MRSTQEGSGAWLPLEQASRRLGIPMDTLRRQAYQVPNRDGTMSWMVWLSSVEMAATQGLVEAEQPDDGASGQDGFVAALQREVRELQERNAHLTGQLRVLQGQVERAQQTIRLLQARPPAARALVAQRGGGAGLHSWARSWRRFLPAGAGFGLRGSQEP